MPKPAAVQVTAGYVKEVPKGRTGLVREVPPVTKDRVSKRKRNKKEESDNSSEEKPKRSKKSDNKPSYVPTYDPEEVERPLRTKWVHHGEPIMDISKVPQGWQSEEFDLDPSDLEAQIERCEERIQEGIVPWLFEDRLRILKAKKASVEKVMDRFPGVSLPVAQRLEILESQEKYLIGRNDDLELLSNVRNIMSAYKSGELDWNSGLVTYWSHGKQLCEPKPFDLQEFSELNRKHAGHSGFWVEGYQPLEPSNAFMAYRKIPMSRFLGDVTHEPRLRVPISMRFPRGIPHFAPRTLRIPVRYSEVPRDGQRPHVPSAGEVQDQDHDRYTEEPVIYREATPRDPFYHLTFWLNDDTGADQMQIYQGDLEAMRQAVRTSGLPLPDLPPLLGLTPVLLADGTLVQRETRVLEVNMFDEDGKEMCPFWDWVNVYIIEGDHDPVHPVRLCGPWLRHRFYTATCPDSKGRLWVTDSLTGFRHLKHAPIGRSGPVPGLLYGLMPQAIHDRIASRAQKRARNDGLGP